MLIVWEPVLCGVRGYMGKLSVLSAKLCCDVAALKNCSKKYSIFKN